MMRPRAAKLVVSSCAGWHRIFTSGMPRVAPQSVCHDSLRCGPQYRAGLRARNGRRRRQACQQMPKVPRCRIEMARWARNPEWQIHNWGQWNMKPEFCEQGSESCSEIRGGHALVRCASWRARGEGDELCVGLFRRQRSRRTFRRMHRAPAGICKKGGRGKRAQLESGRCCRRLHQNSGEPQQRHYGNI